MPSNRNATVDTKDLVATIAYLIGVKIHIVEKCFDAECHELLQSLYASQSATTIRYLCKLRTALFLKYKNQVVLFFNKEKRMMQDRVKFHIYTCPSCGQKIRIPRGKGKIAITCPKCKNEFIKKS